MERFKNLSWSRLPKDLDAIPLKCFYPRFNHITHLFGTFELFVADADENSQLTLIHLQQCKLFLQHQTLEFKLMEKAFTAFRSLMIQFSFSFGEFSTYGGKLNTTNIRSSHKPSYLMLEALSTQLVVPWNSSTKGLKINVVKSFCMY